MQDDLYIPNNPFGGWCPLFGSFWERFHESDLRYECQQIINESRKIWNVPFHLVSSTTRYPKYEEIIEAAGKWLYLYRSPPTPSQVYPEYFLIAARCIFYYLEDIRLEVLIVDPQKDWLQLNEIHSKPVKELHQVQSNYLTELVRSNYLWRYGYELSCEQSQKISDAMILSCFAIAEAWIAYEYLSSENDMLKNIGSERLIVASNLLNRAILIELNKNRDLLNKELSKTIDERDALKPLAETQKKKHAKEDKARKERIENVLLPRDAYLQEIADKFWSRNKTLGKEYVAKKVEKTLHKRFSTGELKNIDLPEDGKPYRIGFEQIKNRLISPRERDKFKKN